MGIYLIRNTVNGCIKIGTSTNPEARIRSLQTATPDRLETLAILEGGPDRERELHWRFARCRISGEWFRPDAAMESVVKSLIRSTEPIVVCGQKVRSVYLAGKIARHGWRDSITCKVDFGAGNCGFRDQGIVLDFSHFVDGLRDSGVPVRESAYDPASYPSPPLWGWPVAIDAVAFPDGRNLNYAGPFFVACGHGCSHSVGHSWGDSEECCNAPTDLDVPGWCLGAIRRADFLFAWIDTTDCHGTLIEMGYARALKIPVLVASPHFHPDLWFAYGMANRVHFDSADARTAFDLMVIENRGEPFDRWRSGFRSSYHFDPIDDRDNHDYWKDSPEPELSGITCEHRSWCDGCNIPHCLICDPVHNSTDMVDACPQCGRCLTGDDCGLGCDGCLYYPEPASVEDNS